MTKYQRYKIIIQIHKFTIKIDTISINLLFECVKIVEFNFNSHEFLVMYQDVRFLNKEERRQFLISSVSEREWKREHRLDRSFWSFLYSKCKWSFRRFALPFAALRRLCQRKYRWGTRRISCKTSRGISTPFVWFVGDVWSSYGVGPGESAYSGFGAIDAGNELQITITCKLNSDFHYQGNTEESSTHEVLLRRIHSYLLSKGQVMLKTLLTGPGT